ncbi:MAG: mandelate racemase/muconate lactonizing enzyme family protein [Trueperaceae bacterium]|nr:MAG: mandelate racemase/muconate lactonizing enzyme family protein [Trueperaceae bacterium]
MRITAVEALHLRLPVVREVADGTQEVLIVRVRTDEGLVGFGEVVSSSYVAKAVITAPKSAPRRHGLAAVLVGTDPLEPEARWQEMYEASRVYGRRGVAIHAMSGIDQALWDIVGKASGKSVSDVWGRMRDRVRAYASVLFPQTPEQAAAETLLLIDKGASAIKFGWGPFGVDRELDMKLVGAIRKAAGDDIEIMVDAGRIWDVETAAERARELFERFGITWLEDPLHNEAPEGYRTLCSEVSGRIATGELDDAFEMYEALIDSGVRVVQPDVGRAGGLTVCRQVSDLAYQKGVWAVPHCFGTGINLAASLQWMGSAPDAPFIEYPFTESPLRNELVPGLPVLEDGWVRIPDGPGLGVGLDEAVVERFRER